MKKTNVKKVMMALKKFFVWLFTPPVLPADFCMQMPSAMMM